MRKNIVHIGAILGVLFAVLRWFDDRSRERQNAVDARFESVVEKLGSEILDARIGAANLLSTYVRTDNEKFHDQVFNLAVGYLRKKQQNEQIKLENNPVIQVLAKILVELYPNLRDKYFKKITDKNPALVQPQKFTIVQKNVICQMYN